MKDRPSIVVSVVVLTVCSIHMLHVGQELILHCSTKGREIFSKTVLI
jgi:hypothetical protein